MDGFGLHPVKIYYQSSETAAHKHMLMRETAY